MRKIGFIAFIMSLASSFFMFAIGFAMWSSFTLPETETRGGSLKAYNVVDYVENDYISLKDTGGIEMFSYSDKSFVSTDGKTMTNTGTITANYTINLDACQSAINENGELTVEILLQYGNLNLPENESAPALFETLSEKNGSRKISAQVKVKVEGSDETVLDGTAQTYNGTSFLISHTFKNMSNSGTYDFTVVYTFEIPKEYTYEDFTDTDNFKNTFGKYLKSAENDKTEFITTATIKGLS